MEYWKSVLQLRIDDWRCLVAFKEESEVIQIVDRERMVGVKSMEIFD